MAVAIDFPLLRTGLVLVVVTVALGACTSEATEVPPGQSAADTLIPLDPPATLRPVDSTTTAPTTSSVASQSEHDIVMTGQERFGDFVSALQNGELDAAFERLDASTRGLFNFWAYLARSATREELMGTAPLVRSTVIAIRITNGGVVPQGPHILGTLSPEFLAQTLDFTWYADGADAFTYAAGEASGARIWSSDERGIGIYEILERVEATEAPQALDSAEFVAGMAASLGVDDQAVADALEQVVEPVEGGAFRGIGRDAWDPIVNSPVTFDYQPIVDATSGAFVTGLSPSGLLGLARTEGDAALRLLTLQEAVGVIVLRVQHPDDLAVIDAAGAAKTLLNSGVLQLSAESISDALDWELRGIDQLNGRSEGGVEVLLGLHFGEWRPASTVVGFNTADFPEAVEEFSRDPVRVATDVAEALLVGALAGD